MPTATSVADLVIANPASARVFERHGIDYCCHGQRPLADACAEAGVELAVVLDELAVVPGAVTTTPPPQGIGGLIEHIVSDHHTYLRRELPRLAGLTDQVVAAHGGAHPELHDVAATLSELTADLIPHLMKEEKVLFPLAIELLGAVEATAFHCGTVQNPIRVMFAEHDRAGELLAALRHLTGGYEPPSDACPTWRALCAGLAELEADTHRHVHLENNVLFPAITALESTLARASGHGRA